MKRQEIDVLIEDWKHTFKMELDVTSGDSQNWTTPETGEDRGMEN